MSATYPFVKGHGTENDFILLPDPDGTVHGGLEPAVIAALCDRRAGIGADGVIRVIRCKAYDDPAAVSARGAAEWFMDYRNSDGSMAEMCGNGIRVLARYLADHEGVSTTEPLLLGTRSGIKSLTFATDGQIAVDMGEPQLLADTKIAVDDRTWAASHVEVGNAHAVAFVDDLADAGSLTDAPAYDPSVYPTGVNVEFVVRRGERHVAMRVHERGSGETRSCGTGACAVAVAAALADDVARGASYRVDVPGGRLTVTWQDDGHLLLAGPAVLVACGEVAKPLASTP